MKIVVEAESVEELKTLLSNLIEEDRLKSSPSIYPLDIGPRTLRCLRSEGIETVAQLMTYSDRALLRIPHFGRKSLAEIHDLALKIQKND